MLHPSQFSTIAPSNVNDSDLSPTTWELSPWNRKDLTQSSYIIFKHNLATMCRQTFDALVNNNSAPVSYSKVLDLDAGFHRVLEQLPTLWQTLQNDFIPEKETYLERHNRWWCNLARDGVYSRLVRLHRPFLERGFANDSTYRLSFQQCLNSAKAVVYAQRCVLDVNANFWFAYNSTLSATMVLFCYLFYLLDTSGPEEAIADVENTIAIAVVVFDRPGEIHSRLLGSVASKGLRIIQGLQRAADLRRNPASSSSDPAASLKTFAQVLLECARELDTPEVEPATALNSIEAEALPDFSMNGHLWDGFYTEPDDLFQALGMTKPGESMFWMGDGSNSQEFSWV